MRDARSLTTPSASFHITSPKVLSLHSDIVPSTIPSPLPTSISSFSFLHIKYHFLVNLLRMFPVLCTHRIQNCSKRKRNAVFGLHYTSAFFFSFQLNKPSSQVPLPHCFGLDVTRTGQDISYHSPLAADMVLQKGVGRGIHKPSLTQKLHRGH